MAITITASNHYKYQLGTANINFSSDVFKMILMDTSFVFDKDTHATLANVTANQIATGNGYTQNSVTLANVSLTEEDTNDKFVATWDNVTISASGGAIEDFIGCIIYDDTTSDDTVIFYANLDTTVSLTDGLSFVASNIYANIA
jgi:hypothetical protein